MDNAQNKLIGINSRMGAKLGTQDTTRTIFDTVTSSGTRFEFFKNFNKTALETNLTRNKLEAEESMVIQELLLTQESAGFNIFDGYANFNLIVGNQRVIKDLSVHFDTNPSLSFFPIKAQVNKFISIPMITQIVIPPNVEFQATLDIFTPIANAKVKCVLAGYGRLFNTNRSF